MEEGDAPGGRGQREGAGDKGLVLLFLEIPLIQPAVFRRVNTDELDLRTEGNTVEEAGVNRGVLLGAQPLEVRQDIKVVVKLRAVVALFGLAVVVVADGGEDRHPI